MSEELRQQYDVVVVGGGAAGLSGAMALSRSRRSVLVVDAGAPRNAPAGHVHNYLGREGTPPGELLAAGRAEVATYGGQVVSGTVVDAQPLEDGVGFRLTLEDGRTTTARRLLVTTGLVDELPDIPGLAQRWGRDVLHCPFCHGWEVRDRAIGVLATGPMAAHQAQLFRQLSADVTFLQHTGPTLTRDQQDELAAREIRVVDGKVIEVVVEGDRLTGVRLDSGEVVALQAVTVGPTFRARADLLVDLGLEVTPMEMDGHVLATHVPGDARGATAVPGVWVAGNVADPMAQLIVSAAAGLMAGAAIHADLMAEDVRNAVAADRERRVS